MRPDDNEGWAWPYQELIWGIPVKNAEQASELVKQFLAKMNETVFFLRKAERADGVWIVEMRVGFARDMRFELDAGTGEILRYTTSGA